MRRVTFLISLGIIILSHIVLPRYAQLDWPTVALIALFLSVLFWPELKEILPTIKKLRIGNTEIETWESVRKLHHEVELAEELPAMPVRQATGPHRTETIFPFERAERILSLASEDKEMAVLRVATEIEKELLKLFENSHLDPKPPHTIRETVDVMLSKGALPQELGRAIIEFRNVRNKIAHPIRQRTVDDRVLTSAIDSGVRILQLLFQLNQS